MFCAGTYNGSDSSGTQILNFTYNPANMAFDSSGNMYVAGVNTHIVYKYSKL